MGPHDFTLPTETGAELVFDATRRAAKHPLLFFYRGYW
jgi:hypothetical protein